jgi:hypothetical protein
MPIPQTNKEANSNFDYKLAKMGQKYVLHGKCPKCGSDLEVTYGIAEVCVNWQHPTVKEMGQGNRTCDYALMGG